MRRRIEDSEPVGVVVRAIQEAVEEELELLPRKREITMAAFERKQVLRLDAMDEETLAAVEGSIASPLRADLIQRERGLDLIYGKLHLLTPIQRNIIRCLIEGIPEGVVMFEMHLTNRTYRTNVRQALNALRAAMVEKPN